MKELTITPATFPLRQGVLPKALGLSAAEIDELHSLVRGVVVGLAMIEHNITELDIRIDQTFPPLSSRQVMVH